MDYFEIKSGVVVCSDPCYEIPTWTQGIIDNVKNGNWAHYIIENEDGRVSTLVVHHSNYDLTDITKLGVDHIGSYGVDSGQFGFFDKVSYRNDDSAVGLPKVDWDHQDDEDGYEWYKACAKQTLSDESYGLVPNGIVTSSGYGDGVYPVSGAKNSDGEYVAFSVNFLLKEEEESIMDLILKQI